MNPLIDVIPAKARKYVYALITLAAVVWGVYEASGGDWQKLVGGLIVALTTATAASNTAPVDIVAKGGYWGGVRAADETVSDEFTKED